MNVSFQTGNLATPPGGTIVATDTVNDVQFQRVKLDIGTNGNSSPVTPANPVPVTGTVDVGTIPAITGTVEVTNFPNSYPVTGPLTDAELRANAVPVIGPLTNSELRANAVPVTGPLTDTQLRANAVPVSGPLTNTELRANAVTIDITKVAGTAASVTNPLFTRLTDGTNAAATQANPIYTRVPPTSTDKDAFGRNRVSLPSVLGFGQNEYGLNAQFLETQVSGSGVVASVVNEATITLATGGTASGALARVQTKAFFRYVPGRSQLIRFTGSFAAPIANVRQRAGYFSARDGMFLEYDGTTLYFVRRTYVTGTAADNRIARSAWHDPMDGSGPSGINLNLAGGTTWLAWIDLEWLGVGRYRFGFASPITGELLVAYAGAGTNSLDVPYMRTANLPVRYEIENTGTAAAAKTLKFICYSVDTEGGDEGEIPLQFPVDNGVTPQSLANGTFKPVLAIRAAAAGPNSVPNRGQTILKAVQAAITGNAPGIFRLVLNPTTLTQNGGAITWTAAGAITEQAVFSTANDTIAGGTLVGESFYVTASATNKGTTDVTLFRKFPLVYSELNSIQDTLVLEAAGIGGTSAAVGAISFQELY
jgi:hypothetical protein